MKKIRLFVVILTATLTFSSAMAQSETFKISGRTINSQGAVVDYATVVLLKAADSTQAAGATSDISGNFSMNIPKGEYVIQAMFLGYTTYKKKISITGNNSLGDITLTESATKIKEVVVEGKLITREADHFVLNIAGSTAAIGKNADEVLALAPGVWVKSGEGVSINGRGGTRVMVNNRLLRESGDELINYLNSIKAEDVQRIEVIPYSGADYDADMTGGVIKITLKRVRDDGMNGSLTMQSGYTNLIGFMHNPSLNINYKTGNLNLYSTILYGSRVWGFSAKQDVIYSSIPQSTHSSTESDMTREQWSGRLGLVYELSKRHSLGLEAEIAPGATEMLIYGELKMQQGGQITDVLNRSTERDNTQNYSLSGNYIYQIDTIGSTFKLLFDYNNRDAKKPTDYFSQYNGFQNFDSTYRNKINTINGVYSITANVDLVLGRNSKLSTGAKFTYYNMNNSILYEYLNGGNWNKIESQSSLNQYSEKIGALYVKYSKKFKNDIALNVGLRGEYTYSTPTTSSSTVRQTQSYFDLFPNANLMIPLTKNGKNNIVFGYNRKISRPSFWNLTPFRRQVSEFSYITGNPNLKASYFNEINANYVLASKYSITVGYNQTKGEVQQVGRIDPQDSNVILYEFQNIQDNTNYYVDISIPIKVGKWWSFTTNATAIRGMTEVKDVRRSKNTFTGRMNHSFNLPAKLIFEVDGYYRSATLAGNMQIGEAYRVNARVKRTFANNRFTASLGVDNIFDSEAQRITVVDTDFKSVVSPHESWRSFRVSLRYNFKAGKSVKVKNIESGATEEKSRL